MEPGKGRKPGKIPYINPLAVLEYLRDVVCLIVVMWRGSWGAHGKCAPTDEYCSVGKRYGAGIPAAIVHERLRTPLIPDRVVNRGAGDALAIEDMPSGHHQRAIRQEGVAGAEKIDWLPIRI